MAFGSRDPNAGSTTSASGYPISRSLGLVILAALAVLIVMRHLFGSIRVEVGTR
jgi:hypothetical protein